MSDRETLEAALRDARGHLNDLTRQLDESPEADMDAETAEELDRTRLRIVELERLLALLDT